MELAPLFRRKFPSLPVDDKCRVPLTQLLKAAFAGTATDGAAIEKSYRELRRETPGTREYLQRPNALHISRLKFNLNDTFMIQSCIK